jgi:hypothetical protein
MTLQEAEFIANEFNKLTSVQSAEVVPNVDDYYSVFVTRTDGRRAVSCGRLSQHADAHVLLARNLRYPRRSNCVSRIDQRTKLGLVPVG